jgi:hypothetical protein
MMKKEDIVSPQQQVSGGSNTPGSSATRMDVEEPTEDGDESDDGGVTQNPRSSQAKPQGGSKRKVGSCILSDHHVCSLNACWVPGERPSPFLAAAVDHYYPCYNLLTPCWFVCHCLCHAGP